MVSETMIEYAEDMVSSTTAESDVAKASVSFGNATEDDLRNAQTAYASGPEFGKGGEHGLHLILNMDLESKSFEKSVMDAMKSRDIIKQCSNKPPACKSKYGYVL